MIAGGGIPNELVQLWGGGSGFDACCEACSISVLRCRCDRFGIHGLGLQILKYWGSRRNGSNFVRHIKKILTIVAYITITVAAKQAA